jgi:hypothetical protein
MSIMYPTIASVAPPSMKTPLRLYLSDRYVTTITVTNATAFGGTLKRLTLTFEYPIADMIVGRKSVKDKMGVTIARASMERRIVFKLSASLTQCHENFSCLTSKVEVAP